MVSVKSFKAKERLLVSGTGTLHAPTIGWGRFNVPSEWTKQRLEAYLFSGFLAIYMPSATISLLPSESKKVENFYRRPLICPIKDFGNDLQKNIINFGNTPSVNAGLLQTSKF